MLISRDEDELNNFKRNLLSRSREKAVSTSGGVDTSTRDVLIIPCDLRDSWSTNYIFNELKRHGTVLEKVFVATFSCFFRISIIFTSIRL